MQAWSPEALGRRIERVPLCYSHSNASFWWHDNNNLLGRQLGLRVREPHGFERDLAGAAFFDAAAAAGGAGRNGSRYLYLSEKLTVPPFDALAVDAEPRAFLAATDDVAGGGRDVILWAGDEGTTAHPHYDPTHTMFAQLVGRKTFTLWPPERWPSMALHPHGHPGHRQSQHDLGAGGAPPPLHPACGGGAAPGCAPAVRATLDPGELLYVPPFWFHTVVAHSFSVAASVVTDSREGERFDAACRAGLPPRMLVPAVPPAARAAAAARYFGLLLARLLPPRRRATYVSDTLVGARLVPLGPALGCDRPFAPSCPAGAADDATGGWAGEAELIGRVAAAIAGGAREGDALDGVGHIVLQDYVEHVAGYAVGVSSLCSFLQCVARG